MGGESGAGEAVAVAGGTIAGKVSATASATAWLAAELASGDTRSGTTDPPPLHARVAAYTRYAELAAAQLTALGNDDLDAFVLLAAQRDAIAAEIDAGPDLAALVESATTAAAIAPLVAQARAALAQGIADASAIEERLQTLRDDARSAIHEFEDRERALRQYLETDGAPAAALDISL